MGRVSTENVAAEQVSLQKQNTSSTVKFTESPLLHEQGSPPETIIDTTNTGLESDNNEASLSPDEDIRSTSEKSHAVVASCTQRRQLQVTMNNHPLSILEEAEPQGATNKKANKGSTSIKKETDSESVTTAESLLSPEKETSPAVPSRNVYAGLTSARKRKHEEDVPTTSPTSPPAQASRAKDNDPLFVQAYDERRTNRPYAPSKKPKRARKPTVEG